MSKERPARSGGPEPMKRKGQQRARLQGKVLTEAAETVVDVGTGIPDK